MSRWHFEESIADLKSKTERVKDRRRRELMQIVNHHNGKLKAKAIRELESIYTESKLRFWSEDEIRKIYG